MHWARRAASLADCTAGNSKEIKTAMIAITTSNSMSVNALRLRLIMKTQTPATEKVIDLKSGQ
jgi:hypothetical protein